MSFKTLNENPRFQINEYGDIWDTKKLRYMKPYKTNHTNPYLFINIYNPENYKRKLYYVHHLVMKYFGSPKPFPDAEIDHLDGDKSNNYVYNLDWVSHKENITRAKALGLATGCPKGSTWEWVNRNPKNAFRKSVYEKKKKGAPKRTESVKSIHWNIIRSHGEGFEDELKQAVINYYEYQKIGNADGAWKLYTELLKYDIDLAKVEFEIIEAYYKEHLWKNDQILAKFNEKYEN